jgi:hypothetical protein
MVSAGLSFNILATGMQFLKLFFSLPEINEETFSQVWST